VKTRAIWAALLWLVAWTSGALAQDCSERYSLFSPTPQACLEPIVTDRPHKTDTPAVLTPGHAQAEIGVVEYGFSPRATDEITIWNTQLKLGIVDWLDLEGFYAPISGPVSGTELEISGDYALRAKLLVLRAPDDAWLITLVPYVEASRRELTGAGGSVFTGYDFASGLELELNVGYVASLQGERGRLVVTSALTQGVVGELSAFVELFTESFPGGTGHGGSLDVGFLYIVSRDVQIDAGIYWGLYGDEPLATFFFGTSLRI
jgi:hypothetical protein